jgi:hypothetical protein
VARYANRARRFLVSRGFVDLSFIDKPCRVLGIPFVEMKVTPSIQANDNRPFLADPTPGVVPIVWKVADEEEDHRVLLRGIDFAPMLAAWIESERSKRV